MAAYALSGIFVMGCLLYSMESYVIRCPEQSEWNIRAEIHCKNITKYFCLYNYIHYTYEEGCTGPEWDIPGSKRVYSRNFNIAPCRNTRYQPIRFVTNGNSDCIFRKSLCTEEGQTLFSNGTTRTDSTCRCDYTQGYAFVTVPRSKCYCRPSEEDCSCYLKKCQVIGYNLSADYECTKYVTKKTVCPLMSENASEDAHIDMEPPGTPRENDSYAIRRKFDVVIVVLVCIFGMIVITMCFMFHQRLPRCLQQSTKKDGIRLEETVSGNNDDNQIALRESDKNGKYVLKKLEVYIEKEGLDAALKHLKEDLDNCRNERFKLAVTGKSGVGKSSFINAIRNLKVGDPGFAATSCSGNTTKHPTVYEYAGNPKITLHELPGFRTTICSENEYKEIMDLSKYDCFLIFVKHIKENDIKIAKILKEMKKPFCFVRSKLDIYFQNAKNDGKSETEVIEEIMSKFLNIRTTNGFKEAKCFVISNYNRRIGHFNELVLYIQSKLPKLNCDVVKLSMFGEISDEDFSYDDPSDDIMDIIYEKLKERALKISLTSKCLATKPISNMDKKSIISLICKELLSYRKAFGFEQQFVKDILKDDHIRQKLNASSIVEIQPTNEAMRKFVENKFIESGEDTSRLLNQVLDGCRDDHKLVRLHQRNLTGNTESKRMGTGPSLETIYQNGSNHEPGAKEKHKGFDNKWQYDLLATCDVEVE